MRIIDLTHPLEPGMPVYPGTPPVKIEPLAAMEEDGFREARLHLTSHTGTHMDAPAHMLCGGKRLDELNPESFMGTARCLRAESGGVTAARLEKELPRTPDCDFLLLHTGWDRYWGRDDYFTGYPVIHAAAATWLAAYGLKGIGLDTPSPDPMDSADYPAHRILLEKRILLIENLRGLDRLPEKEFRLIALPLPIQGGDGAPARVIAIFD